MVDTRPKVFLVAFAMLTTASIFLIVNEGSVSANAWGLLALSGVFAATAVMRFFQDDEGEKIDSERLVDIQETGDIDAQSLPDPSESGFDIPVI